ncbi:hypothetical protein UFOVP1476_37 [uncultured Caudovirales phage]|uniref:Uncharacterized protein n=1 Tax=uncultured Caudovirales phage TaxID=2100421 RepID=A0A6J5PPA8_9CAUD|nr:hypothetical protein UFOVP944_9 [uncultured Caudovirales phage]CAB4203253.1 hypothetical protein UFOVP1381_11 [uncultured Caudovirales phage]CAB4216091.1 hypothetical protein UFOVP1476_37 [uncultured Caudovirales phage]
MSWSVWLLRDTAEEVTDQVRVGSISAGTTASPSGLGMQFETLGGLIDGAVIGSQVQIRDGASVIFRGIVNAIERGDAGSVAGQYASTAYICSDIYGLLRSTIIPTPEPDSAAEAAQEQPSGFRSRIRSEDPDPAAGLDETPAGMFAWALGLIEDLEAARAVRRMPIISLSTEFVSATPEFTFTKYFPMVAESSYWDLLNDVATMAGQGWSIDPVGDPEDGADFILRTWNAIDRDAGNTASFEITDSPDIDPSVEGRDMLIARTISIAEDATDVVNKIEVSWEKASAKTPGLIIDKRVTVSDAESIGLYGERFERLSTEFRTAQMAEAAGLRKIGSAKRANVRGNARLPWDASVKAGRWVNIHRIDHPGDHDGHFDIYAWISTIRPAFEPGYVNPSTGQEEPAWMDIDFNSDPYEASAFRPFVPTTASAGGGKSGDGTTPTVPVLPSPIGSSGNYVLVNVEPMLGPLSSGARKMPLAYSDFFQREQEPKYTPKSFAWTSAGGTVNRASLMPKSTFGADAYYGGGNDYKLGDTTQGLSSIGLFKVQTNISLGTQIKSARLCLVVNAPTATGVSAVEPGRVSGIAVAQLSYVPYGSSNTPLGIEEMMTRLLAGGSAAVPPSIGGSIVGNVHTFALGEGTNRFVIDFNPGLYPAAESAYSNTKMSAYFVIAATSSTHNKILVSPHYMVARAFATVNSGTTGVPSPSNTQTWIVDRAVPTRTYLSTDPTEYRNIGFNISKDWSASFGSYALIQISGTASSEGVQSTSNEFSGKFRQYAGQTSFTLSAPGKREGMVVRVYTTSTAYGETVNRAKDITSYVTTSLNDAGQVVSIDIARAASYGLLANQRLTVEFGS